MKQVKNLIELLEIVPSTGALCVQIQEGDEYLCGDISCENCPLYSAETFSDLIQELKEASEGDAQ